MMAVASVAGAQQDAASARPVDDCQTTLKAGSGPAYTKVCISSTGNITSYESPAGVEHIRVLDPVEGYRVCKQDGWASLWDSGSEENGFYDPNGVSRYQPNGANTLPLRITRVAFNGLRVSQEFFFKAHSYGPAELKIEMKVANTGTETIPAVHVQRFFDGDINGRLSNHGFVTTSTALLMIPGGNTEFSTSYRGLSLSAGILDKKHWANVGGYGLLQYAEDGYEGQCDAGDPGMGQGPNPEDKIGVVTFAVGDLTPGRLRTVSFIYRRF
jgi:hypothetical protein